MLKKASHLFVGTSIVLFFLSVFTSASGLGASSTAAAIAIVLYFVDTKNWEQARFPKSSYFLLAIVAIGFLSFISNYTETSQPYAMLSKLKYYIVAGLWIPVLKSFARDLSKKEKTLNILVALLFYGLLISIAIAGIYGFLNVPFGERSHGLIGIMRFSYTLALLSPLVWLYALSPDRKISKYVPNWMLYVLLLVILACILTTQARGGVIGYILGFIVASFFARKKIFLTAMVSLVVITAGLYIAKEKKVPFTRHRYFQSIKSPSNLMRISYFKSALYGVYEKPLLGFGMQRFPSQITRIKKKYKLAYVNANAHSHNVILETAAQVGLLGLLSFLLWLVFWGREMFARGEAGYYFCFVLVFLCIGQFEYIFFTNNMLLTFAVYHFSFILPNKRFLNET